MKENDKKESVNVDQVMITINEAVALYPETLSYGQLNSRKRRNTIRWKKVKGKICLNFADVKKLAGDTGEWEGTAV